MTPHVKRSYSSTKRAAQAAQTRRSILEAAQELFVTRGYNATTIQSIADESGVAVQTVYAAFGNKPELLRQVIEGAIVGDSDLPITEQADALAIGAEPDPWRRAALDAHMSRAITERVRPIVRVAREAATSDAEMARLFEAMKAARRAEMVASAELLAGPTGLRVDIDQAAATLYVLYSPDVAELLMNDYRWSAQRYERWLAYMLFRTLLDPRPAGLDGDLAES